MYPAFSAADNPGRRERKNVTETEIAAGMETVTGTESASKYRAKQKQVYKTERLFIRDLLQTRSRETSLILYPDEFTVRKTLQLPPALSSGGKPVPQCVFRPQ